MTRQRIALVVLLVAASCGGADAEPGTTTTAAPTTTSPISTSVATGATSATTITVAATDPPDRADVEDYLVELSNALGEGDNRRRTCEERAQAENPIAEDPTPSEVERFLRAMYSGCFVGEFGVTTDSIATLTPPAGFSDHHDEYVSSRRDWVTIIAPLADAMKTAEDLQALFGSPEFQTATEGVGTRCRALESAATGAGFVISLMCPAPTDQEPSTEVQVDFGESGLTAQPAGVIDTGGGVEIVLVNADGRSHRPVVATLFSGDPGRLPIRDDVVDLRQSGVVFSEGTDPDHGYFALNWPEVTGENWDANVPELAPGGELSVVVGPGEYVVFDHSPGTYGAGGFIVLVVVSSVDLEATYIAPPYAAESCAELAGAVIGIYDAYLEEVAHLTAESFLQSPLSMIDDLRFGAALVRTEQLGCDGDEHRSSLVAQLCPSTEPDGTAPGEILDRLCAMDG